LSSFEKEKRQELEVFSSASVFKVDKVLVRIDAMMKN
jgi:hypothetical protein